jgi:hypothetical protein
MKHKFYAEPLSAKRRTWVVYVVGEGIVVDRIKADDAATAIRKAQRRIKRIGLDLERYDTFTDCRH